MNGSAASGASTRQGSYCPQDAFVAPGNLHCLTVTPRPCPPTRNPQSALPPRSHLLWTPRISGLGHHLSFCVRLLSPSRSPGFSRAVGCYRGFSPCHSKVTWVHPVTSPPRLQLYRKLRQTRGSTRLSAPVPASLLPLPPKSRRMDEEAQEEGPGPEGGKGAEPGPGHPPGVDERREGAPCRQPWQLCPWGGD